MTETSPANVVAGCLGLAAFAIALLAGLGSGAEADVVLLRAVVSMFVCFLVGYVVGLAGEHAMNEAARRYRDEHPIHHAADRVQADDGHEAQGDHRPARAEGAL